MDEFPDDGDPAGGLPSEDAVMGSLYLATNDFVDGGLLILRSTTHAPDKYLDRLSERVTAFCGKKTLVIIIAP